MLLSEFDFELPDALIAQQPLAERDSSRMLVFNRRESRYKDDVFISFPSYLRSGDTLVLNNTQVFPARLYGKSETGAGVEVLLVEELRPDVWSALARPGKKLRVGKRISFGKKMNAEVLKKEESGRITLEFKCDGEFEPLVDELGVTPLPPYIKRSPSDSDPDRQRYQTLYAKKRGAIAAPTAGLHFTGDLLSKIAEKGVEIVEITLHVGYGTFEPVRVEDVSLHRVAPERFDISPETAEHLTRAKKEGRRIVAVGTTTTRALESAFREDDAFRPGQRWSELTILPGYEFRAVDCLLTNFHLPKSSLLVLVSTFGGREAVLRAYGHAVKDRYRFYSYGDCMLIE